MQKLIRVIFTTACVISSLVGGLHFVAPHIFSWYSYIPDAPVEIYQSINYINFCFSFLLAGFSLILLTVRKALFTGSAEAKLFYTFFVLVWLSRVIIQTIWPWPSGLQLWLVTAFFVEFSLTAIPLIYLLMRPQIIPNDKGAATSDLNHS